MGEKRKRCLYLSDEAVTNIRKIALGVGMTTSGGEGSLSGLVNMLGENPEIGRRVLLATARHAAERKAEDLRRALQGCETEADQT